MTPARDKQQRRTGLAMTGTRCPLCDHGDSRASWLRDTRYGDELYRYRRCCGCGSLYCVPMPSPRVVREMYGRSYALCDGDPNGIGSPKRPEAVVERLKRLGRGTFVDYGCGDGRLLIEAAKVGWEAVGVELNEGVARQVRQRTGYPVLTSGTMKSARATADVLHLGDVIEHLTDMSVQMRDILGLVKPGGLIMAQGPLEGNSNLFFYAVRALHRVKPRQAIERPPYHVILATAEGQEKLFRRFGLEQMEFRISEVPWPAPQRLTRVALRSPRSLSLYLLRLASQAVSSWVGGRWGNRYFYVGRWTGATPSPYGRGDEVSTGRDLALRESIQGSVRTQVSHALNPMADQKGSRSES